MHAVEQEDEASRFLHSTSVSQKVDASLSETRLPFSRAHARDRFLSNLSRHLLEIKGILLLHPRFFDGPLRSSTLWTVWFKQSSDGVCWFLSNYSFPRCSYRRHLLGVKRFVAEQSC